MALFLCFTRSRFLSALKALIFLPVISKASRIISARWRYVKTRNSGNIRPAIKAGFQMVSKAPASAAGNGQAKPAPASASQRQPARQRRR
jgi:hypothetical protein